jgi:hypothetical protein
MLVCGPRPRYGTAKFCPRVLIWRRIIDPILSPDGDVVGAHCSETGAAAWIVGGGRMYQEDGETLEAFEARVEAAAGA